MQKQTEIPRGGGHDRWDANWKIGSPYGKPIYFTNCVAKDYGTDCEIVVVRSEPQALDAR